MNRFRSLASAWLLGIAALLTCTLPTVAATTALVITKTSTSIKIDGILDDEAWKTATVIPLNNEWTPGDNIAAPVTSECLLTYNSSCLYIAFRCLDPEPQNIRAHLMDRDAIDSLLLDDFVGIVLDSFNDERRGFLFRSNPLGVQADANYSEIDNYEDYSWDAIWESAGHISSNGYTVEMAIPFNQLRFSHTNGTQTWGFSAERSWPRNVRHRIAPHVRSRDSACLLCQFIKISGFENITAGNNIEIDGTLTINRSDERPDFPNGDLAAGKIMGDPGITAKWGITPSLILNAAINPDFSQVEADAAQLNVNTRYALYYPEKRPFFLEGGDFFLTPLQTVFTRTVADPLWGVKLTSKAERSAIGVFATEDSLNNLIIPSNQGSFPWSINQNVLGGVVRYRYDLGNASTLGLLYTGRVGDDYFNHVIGGDGFLRFDQKSSLNFQYLHSTTVYPADLNSALGRTDSTFAGNAIDSTFRFTSRDWLFKAEYTDISDGFRTDFGYLPRTDTRSVSGVLHRQFWGEHGGWFDQILIGFAGSWTWNHHGDFTDQNLILGLTYQGALQTQASLQGLLVREQYGGINYNESQLNVSVAMNPSKGVSLSGNFFYGDYVDYANFKLGTITSFTPALALSIGHHINLQFSHNLEHLARAGGKVYTANLTQLKWIYNFSVRCYLRAIVQYLNVSRDPSKYIASTDAQSNSLFTQLLFSYKINARTVFFLGYTDNSLGDDVIALTRANRTFFMKIGYALSI